VNVDALPHARVFGRAATAGAECAGTVGIVHQQHGAVSLRQLHHLRQRRDVSIHAVDAVDSQKQASAVGRRSPERLLERGQIAVWEYPEVRLRQPRAVDDRGVVELVGDQRIALSDQRRDDAEVGHVAGVEGQRALRAEEVGQLGLERFVQRQVPGDESRSPGRTPDIPRRSCRGLDDLRVVGEIEVVAARKDQNLAAVHPHARGLRPLEGSHAPVGAPGADRSQHLARDLTQAHPTSPCGERRATSGLSSSWARPGRQNFEPASRFSAA